MKSEQEVGILEIGSKNLMLSEPEANVIGKIDFLELKKTFVEHPTIEKVY